MIRTSLDRLGSVLIVLLFLGGGLLAGTAAPRLLDALRPDHEIPLQAGDFAGLVAGSGTPLVVFSTSTCRWCARTRAYLADHGIAHRDYVIDISPEAKRLYDTLGEQGVPIVLSAHHKLVGFSRKSLANLSTIDAQPVPPR
ncbi:glutaredoxin family protein [Dokdonella sp.]|uniref:glutaredoxin family protein n=1 Tax=Dokdonella sp. TaxID=2291710 RepID=UPI002F3FC97D